MKIELQTKKEKENICIAITHGDARFGCIVPIEGTGKDTIDSVIKDINTFVEETIKKYNIK